MPPARKPEFEHIAEPTSQAGWTNLERGRTPLDRRFPTLHKYIGHHPQRQVPREAGHNVFVIFTENLEPSKKEWARMSQDVDIPLGYSQDMHKAQPGAYNIISHMAEINLVGSLG